MICNINFSTYESDPCWEHYDVLNIEASSSEIDDIYKSISLNSNLIGDDPHSCSLLRYEAFLNELKKRGIKYTPIKSVNFIF